MLSDDWMEKNIGSFRFISYRIAYVLALTSPNLCTMELHRFFMLICSFKSPHQFFSHLIPIWRFSYDNLVRDVFYCFRKENIRRERIKQNKKKTFLSPVQWKNKHGKKLSQENMGPDFFLFWFFFSYFVYRWDLKISYHSVRYTQPNFHWVNEGSII